MKSVRQKKAAIEMSIGTIVTIVLAISFLVLGIFLIQRIGKSATSVVDLTDQELRSQLNKLFSEEAKVVVYPQTDTIQIKQEASGGVGIGIQNLLQGVSGQTTFSYSVSATDTGNCGITKQQAEAWIVTGKSEDNIPIASGDFADAKIIFKIPTGAPLCVASFRAVVSYTNPTTSQTNTYDSKAFNIEVLAK